MRILIISLVYPPEHAPAGIMVAELAEELVRAGHQVTVLTGFPSHPSGRLYPGWKARLVARERAVGGFAVRRCLHSFAPRFGSLGKLWYHFTFAVSSFCVGLSCGPVDVMVFPSTPVFCGPAAILLSVFKRCRSFYWVLDIHPEGGIYAGLLKEGAASKVMKAIDSWVCGRAARVGTLTEDMRNVLLTRGLPADRVVIQRIWLDEDRIRPSSRQNCWRETQGIAPETFVVLHAGTIGYISGAQVAVEAARQLEDHRRILVLFAGDGPLKAALQEQAKEYGLSNVRFLPFQPEEVLNEMQAAADVGLITLRPHSARTSIPSKMYGYMSAGRPVIASVDPVSTVGRFVDEGRFGWVVPPGDPAALARAVLEAESSADECQTRGARARESFVREFGRRTVTAEFRQRLEQLCGAGMD
jgi:colanic acid biosynthesis glycosyl transferase WcaI